MAADPFDIDKLIGEVAKRHNLLLSPDDPIFVTLTLNELIVTRAIAQIETHIESCKEQASVAAAEQIAASKQLAEQIITVGAVYLVGELRTATAEATTALREAVAQGREQPPEKRASNRVTAFEIAWLIALIVLGGTAGAAAVVVLAL